jgi:uncharacterized protein YkwD
MKIRTTRSKNEMRAQSGVNTSGKHLYAFLAVLGLLVPVLRAELGQSSPAPQPEAAQLMELANRARAQAGAQPLKWDRALAEAARKHTLRMAAEGPIAHRYPGELDVSERAGHAGAHFDLLEENVAIAATPEAIHDGWMHSNEHRDNLLNPQVNRVGIAVVASRGVLYATADYSRSVEALSQEQVEARIGGLIQTAGVKIRPDRALARAACAMTSGFPRSVDSAGPGLVIRWQDSNLSQLPKGLADSLASGTYHEAAVGSCEPRGVEGTFTMYRIGVLLY